LAYIYAHNPQICAVNFARRHRARYFTAGFNRAAFVKTDDLGMRGVLEMVLERDKIGSTSARAQDKI